MAALLQAVGCWLRGGACDSSLRVAPFCRGTSTPSEEKSGSEFQLPHVGQTAAQEGSVNAGNDVTLRPETQTTTVLPETGYSLLLHIQGDRRKVGQQAFQVE
jgi:hypothetical protein